jgi:hypothetical protein
MTDDFLTKGLQNDRYMKARQLIEQFEEDIEVELRTIGREMIAENPELFDDNVNGDENSQTKSSTYPFSRIDYPMARQCSSKGGGSLTLNVHLYWYNPREYNRKDIDGAIRALGYKIKNLSEADERRIVSKTSDWSLRVSENRFGSRKAFYRHVSSTDDIEETAKQLIKHFSTFGHEFGVSPDQT